MSPKTDEILESLKKLSLLEASELVKQIEDAFGVSAAASAGVVMAAPRQLDMSGPQLVPAWSVQRLHSCRVPRGTVMALLCAGPPIVTVRDISSYILHMQSTHGTWQILLYTSVYTLGTSLLCTGHPWYR